MLLLFICILLLSKVCNGENDADLDECLKECGLSPTFFDDKQRSFGGWSAPLPFVGQLRISIPECKNFRSTCTAFIGSENFVISAKHCLEINIWTLHSHCPSLSFDSLAAASFDNDGNLKPAVMSFVAQSNVSIIEKENTYGIKEVIQIGTPGVSDAIMLKLQTPIAYTLNKRAACLYSAFNPVYGQQLDFAGFGKVFESDSSRWPQAGDKLTSTSYLHQLHLLVHSDKMCQKVTFSRSEEFICTGSKGAGLTSGDSGGPGFVRHDGRLYVVGIASKAGVLNPEVFDVFIGRHTRPDKFVRLTPALCTEIKTKSNEEVSCMDSMKSPSEKCVKRITDALQLLITNDEKGLLGGKMNDGPKANATEEFPFVIHSEDEHMKKFKEIIHSNDADICTVFKAKQCQKNGSCFIHCQTKDGQCHSPETINESFFNWLRSTKYFNRFAILKKDAPCGEGLTCNSMSECKKKKTWSIFGDW